MKVSEMELSEYIGKLREEEKSRATIQKYAHDIRLLLEWLDQKELTKQELLSYKEDMVAHYSAASVNSMLVAVNGFLDFLGVPEMKLKALKVQKSVFADERKQLDYGEYCRLLRAARKEDLRTYLVIQTICATGIRISELKFVTVESLKKGKAEITNKGKQRTVFLPGKLRKLLLQYAGKKRVKKGAIFITKSGKTLDRSNIWRAMKALCEKAGVSREKVFPHNLRHLFARKYYEKYHDLSRLADILGHSSVNTTRIYTMESGLVHARQLEELGLLIV